MNRIFFIFTFLFLSVSAISFADQVQQVITLKDGSQIKGVLSGIENGVYIIKTPLLGDVHVAAGDVTSITNGDVPAAGSNPAMDQQVAASQKELMSNPQSMAIVQGLTQDPEVMKAISDPSLVQAVTSHDYQAVQSNPKFQELMNTPKMQALLRKLAAQQQQQNTTQ